MDEKPDSSGLTWGSLVRIKPGAPEDTRPGELADVVGITPIDSQILSERYGVDIGTTVYTVEFVDGSDVSLPECWLEMADEQDLPNSSS